MNNCKKHSVFDQLILTISTLFTVAVVGLFSFEVHGSTFHLSQGICEPQTCLSKGKLSENNSNYADAFSYFEAGCNEKQSQACWAYIELLTSWNEVDKSNFKERFSHFASSACDLGLPEACTQLGRKHERGADDFEKDQSKAGEYFKKGCDLNHAKSCFKYANYLEFETYTPAKSLVVHWKGCDLDSSESCGRMAEIYHIGIHDVEADLGKAKSYFEKTCGIDLETRQCRYFSELLMKNTFSENDQELAKEMSKSICDVARGNSSSCNAYADMLIAENSIDNAQKALKYYERSCDDYDQTGCIAKANISLTLDPNEDQLKAAETIFQTACDRTFAKGCLGLYGLFKAKHLGELDLSTSISTIAIDCAAKVQPACLELARIYFNGDVGVSKDLGTALEYLDLACDRNEQACSEFLLDLQSDGKIAESSLEFLQQFNVTSCQKGVAAACFILGTTLANKNDFSDADRVQSDQYLQDSCDLGYRAGCNYLETMKADGQVIEQTDEPANTQVFNSEDLEALCADELIAQACRELAFELQYGSDIYPYDPELAKEVHQFACELGNGPSCETAELITGNEIEIHYKLNFADIKLISECEQGNAQTCKDVGVSFYQGKNKSKLKDEAVALEFLVHSCELGFGDGCAWAASVVRNSRPPMENYLSDSYYLFSEACDLNSGMGCNSLGQNIYSGTIAPSNREGSLASFQKSCALGYGPGCSNVGWLHNEKGVGDYDPIKAHYFFNYACEELANNEGCEEKTKINMDSSLVTYWQKGRGKGLGVFDPFDSWSLACQLGDHKICAELEKF